MATKKIGRNKIGCANYKTQNKRLRNKVRRIERHLKRQPQDAEASDAMHRIKKLRDDYRPDSAKNTVTSKGKAP